MPGIHLSGLPFVPDWPQVILEGPAVGVHIDPDKAGKSLALEFREPQLAAGVALGKVLFIRRKLQRAVGQKRPAMVSADKAPRVAAFWLVHQRIAAMLAHVIEGFDAAVLLAHHQDLFAPQGLHLPVAGLG